MSDDAVAVADAGPARRVQPDGHRLGEAGRSTESPSGTGDEVASGTATSSAMPPAAFSPSV